MLRDAMIYFFHGMKKYNTWDDKPCINIYKKSSSLGSMTQNLNQHSSKDT